MITLNELQTELPAGLLSKTDDDLGSIILDLGYAPSWLNLTVTTIVPADNGSLIQIEENFNPQQLQVIGLRQFKEWTDYVDYRIGFTAVDDPEVDIDLQDNLIDFLSYHLEEDSLVITRTPRFNE